MKTSVVVSTYNRPKALSLVLKGLAEQSLPPDEIVIGDDGSGEDTYDVIRRWQAHGLKITHCWHADEGFRKTIIMNVAVSRAQGDLIIFLDGDCIPLRSFVKDHVSLHEQGWIHAGPRILADQWLTAQLESGSEDIKLSPWFFLVNRVQGHVNRLAPLIRLPDGDWRRSHPNKWELVRGCNFSVVRRSVMEVDGFEESVLGWGLDDSDIAVRLINAGVNVKSLRFAAPVLHLWHAEESRSNLEQNRLYLQEAMQSKRIRAKLGISKIGLSEDI